MIVEFWYNERQSQLEFSDYEMVSSLSAISFGIKYVKRSKTLSDFVSRVHKNKSFEYNFTKAFVDEEDIELSVIHVSNSQLGESKKLYEALFHGLRDSKSIENLAFDKITKKKVKNYLKYVRLDDDGETVLIKNLGEEFVLPKFEDLEKIIPLNHADGHHSFQITIPIIERKYWWPGMYRQIEACLSNCDSCVRYA